MFIYVDGEVAAYLNPASNDDLAYYQTLEGLSTRFSIYLDAEIIKSDTQSGIDDCDSGCSLTEEKLP